MEVVFLIILIKDGIMRKKMHKLRNLVGLILIRKECEINGEYIWGKVRKVDNDCLDEYIVKFCKYLVYKLLNII